MIVTELRIQRKTQQNLQKKAQRKEKNKPYIGRDRKIKENTKTKNYVIGNLKSKKGAKEMKVIIIIAASLFVYYIGLVILTNKSFKRNKIDLGILINLYLPIYIIKSFIKVAIKHKNNRAVRRKALLSIFFDYNIALAILIEVVEFGISKNYIRLSPSSKSCILWKRSEVYGNKIE